MHRIAGIFAILLVAAGGAAAHPVAQGAMDIMIGAAGIDVRARVSNEEAFVAEAFASGGSQTAGLPGVWQRHGAYLTRHIHAMADGTPLGCELARLTPPENSTASERVTYELHFAFPPGDPQPRVITLQQDVLNEFEFAPGNPWEATYVTRMGQQGRTAQEGLLFTRKEPLTFACDWTAPIAAAETPRLNKGRLFAAYLRYGVMHILTGYDHMLFMSALVLAAVTIGDLIKVVTAFTVAHTVTLTLSVLNIVRLPSHIVEPMIAASIVFVALQNVFWPKRTHGWERLAVAFGFGLFHGLGFAGGLLNAMAGLPGVAVATAITAFSIGVELGHQAVVIPIFGGLKLARLARAHGAGREEVTRVARRYGSALICAAGTFYLIAALR